jgi:hypothetical protein
LRREHFHFIPRTTSLCTEFALGAVYKIHLQTEFKTLQQRRIYFHCDSGCKYCNSRLPIGCHGLVRRSFVDNPISILQLRLQTTERHRNYKVKTGSENHFQRPSCAAKSICGLNIRCVAELPLLNSPNLLQRMSSLFGPKRTRRSATVAPAFGGKADTPL